MTTTKFLSQEWLDLQKELGRDLPERPGASARVQFKVTGGPDGDVAFYTVIEDGKVLENALGEDPAADYAGTVAYGDFTKTVQGESDTAVAYMRGRLKVTGNVGKLMALMPFTQSAEVKALNEKVNAQTEY